MVRTYSSITYKFFLFFCFIAALLISVNAGAQEKGGRSEPADLPEELKGMTISDTFIPLFAEAVGTIQTVRGRLIVRHGDTMRAYYAAAGNQLYENDVLYTLEDSRCRLQFVTDEIITMGANSQISVDQVIDNRNAQEKSSTFSMMKGKAMFYALRLFRYKKVNVEVRTPVAVAGIRGTKFGVEVEKKEINRASADPLYLADASGRLPSGLLAQNTPGEGYQVTVYGYDGEVEVTSTADGLTQTVGPGESVVVDEVGAGEVMPTAPDQARQFVEETDVPDEDAGTEETEPDAPETGDAAVEETPADTAGAGAETDASGFSQNQTTEAIQEQAAQEILSEARGGYFSALLTRYYEGSKDLADIYTNSTRANIDAGEVSGNSILDSAGFITATNVNVGAEDEQSYIKRIKSTASWPAVDTGDLGTSAPIDDLGGDDELGSNDYMGWGIWQMTTWVQGASGPGPAANGQGPLFAITDRAYYVGGEVTPDAAVPGISGAYVGPAYGTLFNGTGGIHMYGSFYSQVDGLSKTVPYFDLYVYNGSNFAEIWGSGVFVGNSSEFKINSASYYLNDGAAQGSCQGSLFGPNGEHIGGAWAMQKSIEGQVVEAAVGIFAGDKHTNGPNSGY